MIAILEDNGKRKACDRVLHSILGTGMAGVKLGLAIYVNMFYIIKKVVAYCTKPPQTLIPPPPTVHEDHSCSWYSNMGEYPYTVVGIF